VLHRMNDPLFAISHAVACFSAWTIHCSLHHPLLNASSDDDPLHARRRLLQLMTLLVHYIAVALFASSNKISCTVAWLACYDVGI